MLNEIMAKIVAVARPCFTQNGSNWLQVLLLPREPGQTSMHRLGLSLCCQCTQLPLAPCITTAQWHMMLHNVTIYIGYATMMFLLSCVALGLPHRSAAFAAARD